MVASCLSFVSLFDGYLRRSFSSAGLCPQTIDIEDETTVHFWGPKPDRRASPKPAVVLIHGFGPIALWQWRAQVVAFAPDFDVYVPDLIFFGDSTTRSAERSEIFQAACVGRLLEKVGVERYSLVGTSYGGFVSYQMARMWGDRVEKVVIASSGVNIVKQDNEKLLKRAKAEKVEDFLLPQTPAQLRKLLGLAVFKPPIVMPTFLLNDFLDKLYSENRREKIELLVGLTLGKDDTPKLSPLKQEALIVWGEHDRIFLLEKATQLKELLGEKARLEVIKNASHVPQVENPEMFNSIVKNFLCGST